MSWIRFSTQAEWVNALIKCASYNTSYSNTYPYNLLYWNGSTLTADCVNLLKSLFNGGDPFNLKIGTNFGDNLSNTGDVGEAGLIEQCEYVSSDFSKLKEKNPEVLYMSGHIGTYIGTEITMNGNTYNVIECTAWTGDFGHDGIIYSYVDSYGHRLNHKGGFSSGYNWEKHGKPTKWVRYTRGFNISDSADASNTPTKTFKIRTKSPAGENNPCYMTNLYGASWDGAWNTCIYGSPTQTGANVLYNCTGYAQGRALEIYCELEGYNPSKTGSHPFITLNCDAGQFISRAPGAGLKTSNNPAPGAIMCWSTAGAGHVAVVEEVIDKDTVIATESGYGGICGTDWISHTRRRGSGNWDGDMFIMGGYSFQGFILNPAAGTGSTTGGSSREGRNVLDISTRVLTDEEIRDISSRISGYEPVYTYEDITVTKNFQGLVTADTEIKRTQGAKLLSYPSLVEAPFVILRVGDYSFGTYTKGGDLNKSLNVSYPNFISGMTVQKVNGTVNQYTIELIYQIEAGNDPNLVDKILSKVGYDLVYISYGDWACPTFIYKEEEALITGVKSRVNFSQSQISYTITCTSNSIALAANTFNFPARQAKPSDIIRNMLYNNQYGLLDLFTGMRNETRVREKGLIATNDLTIEIPSKEGMDPLSYINYLVSCMSSSTNNINDIIRDSTYYLIVHDDTKGELGGPYFTITEVKSGASTLSTVDTYEVDVGFPSDNFVTNFQINDDNSWALLYNYASQIDNQRYVYSLDDKGHIVTRYSPNITTSTTGFITTEAQKTWWTNMTQFPITATLEIKGLLRPSMLMSYVRINAFFYGQRHISSGLYIITKQVDTINGSGYKTVLNLTRIGGDYDVISNVTKTVTTQKPKITLQKSDGVYEFIQSHNIVQSVNDAYEKREKAKNEYTGGGGGSKF